MPAVGQDSWRFRLLDAALPAGNDCVCFRIEPAEGVIRSRHGDVPLSSVRRIWIRGCRRRLLFGDRITYTVTLVADVRAFVVLSLRDRDDAERLVADLSLDVPVERYDVTDAPAGPR